MAWKGFRVSGLRSPPGLGSSSFIFRVQGLSGFQCWGVLGLEASTHPASVWQLDIRVEMNFTGTSCMHIVTHVVPSDHLL